MKSAGVAQLKAKLSEYLERVKAGEELLVTDRGRPVARLIPLASSRDAGEEARLTRLERSGLARVGQQPLPKSFWKAERPADPDASVRSALLEERASGR